MFACIIRCSGHKPLITLSFSGEAQNKSSMSVGQIPFYTIHKDGKGLATPD